MNAHVNATHDQGMTCLSVVAAYYRIPADPSQLVHELALQGSPSGVDDVVRAALKIGLKAKGVKVESAARLATLPLPCLVFLKDAGFRVLGARSPDGEYRVVDPNSREADIRTADDLVAAIDPTVVLLQRKLLGPGVGRTMFGFQWFLPSLWRYRKPIGNVLLASLFVQIFALITPMIFQVVIDKVLTHKAYATLFVLVGAIATIGLFDAVMQYLRTYALTHTTNRIDVELGSRLFNHLLKLPVSYFESRPAGQTVARVRELESIRSFLTGQGLFAGLDLLFTFVFIAVLLGYSWQLTLIVLGSIPLYLGIAALVRPPLRDAISHKFDCGAESQQFLVETVVGAQTIKAAAVEPVTQSQWEEKLAAYVGTSFAATMIGAKGQQAIQYVGKLTTAALLMFGAKAVIDGDMTIGSLVAFNMISGQVAQPILRLSQLWQDLQQVQVSVERLGDVLNAAPEPSPANPVPLPPPRGLIVFKQVGFRYKPGAPLVLKDVSLLVRPGEVVGIVGPSGSGKSTLTKLVQRFYVPDDGQVLIDGHDLALVDPTWLRRNIGVVLQDNLLFNRSIHDNIALGNPAMPRDRVMAAAHLAGADEFVSKLPQGYDTHVEERGANLSGGQRQRIAIARALISDPRILIFDEATSALDYESEQIIQTNMREIVKGRTVIVIAHRLAAVRHCDRIIGMVDGRIVESGTHDELASRPGGLYARLLNIQNFGVAA
jgi:subfamily B ATP-binding cassette protein HlyB/CyaB